MIYEILATGSGGNALVIEGKVLIDCGVPWKKIEPYAHGLQLVLLTHEHGDHFNRATVKRLAKERPGLRWAAGWWMLGFLINTGVKTDLIDIAPGWNYEGERPPLDYGSIVVSPFMLTHDVPNCGWKILMDTEDHPGTRIFYATDTGDLNGIVAKWYDYYFLEANYTEAEIEERIGQKKLNGEYIYEGRVKRTHLSKEQADSWLAMNAGSNSIFVYMHNHKVKDNEQVQQP